jgi:hypothetical protein
LVDLQTRFPVKLADLRPRSRQSLKIHHIFCRMDVTGTPDSMDAVAAHLITVARESVSLSTRAHPLAKVPIYRAATKIDAPHGSA